MNPGQLGYEARTLPLCYAAPHTIDNVCRTKMFRWNLNFDSLLEATKYLKNRLMLKVISQACKSAKLVTTSIEWAH